jgi:hypothetical protein
MRPIIALLVFLHVLLSPALAQAGGASATEVTVYVYSPPQVQASVHSVEGGLQCTWTISDLDEGDTFASDIAWLNDGQETTLTDSVTGCTTAERCASAVLAPARSGEVWTCSVRVTDSYGGEGESSADYSITPLGFLGGILDALSRAVCGFLPFC